MHSFLNLAELHHIILHIDTALATAIQKVKEILSQLSA